MAAVPDVYCPYHRAVCLLSMIVLDFETEAIGPRPGSYPPKPVGVALDLMDGKPPAYYSWGHPTENNTTYEKAKAALAKLWHRPIITHNGAGFDFAVALDHFGLPWPEQWEDTMFLGYLDDPHSRALGLKPMAEKVLRIPPTERDEVRDWILKNVPGATAKHWGEHIAKAPGALVGRYASADTRMTRELYHYLYPRMEEAGMQEAYAREKTLAPILEKSSKFGVRVDVQRLEQDLLFYSTLLEDVDHNIRTMLHAPNLNMDSDVELATALESAGFVKPEDWVLTPTGKRSTSKANLEKTMGKAPMRALLRYRGVLATTTGTFMAPWYNISRVTGRLYPQWNQTRNPDGGTRTGRLSCQDPNLMNVSKKFKAEVPEGLPPLPLVREYLIPEPGHVWIRTDASQQELRILAHFAEGEMLARYQADPTTDFHTLAGELIEQNTGLTLQREDVKTIAFSILYGTGADAMAAKMGIRKDQAQELKNAYYDAVPGIRALQAELKFRGQNNMPFKTWGGRQYFCEPPTARKDGYGMQTWEYKMLNYLIQGSAADHTKQVVINYDALKVNGIFLVQVHDEINISCPPEHADSEALLVQQAFADVAFDVKMLSESSVGANYGSVK